MPDSSPPPDHDETSPSPSTPLSPASADEVSGVLAYGLKHDERGRPRKGQAWEVAAGVLADQLASQLERANLVVMKRPPRPPHST